MKIFIKGLNACVMRKQKLSQYKNFFLSNNYEIVDRPDESDFILIWTCGFRKDLCDNSLSEISKYKTKYKSKIIVAGCLPDIGKKLLINKFSDIIILPWKNDAELMEKIFGIKINLKDTVKVWGEKNSCVDAEKFRENNINKDAIFHDQFVKLLISEGCNFNCTYCSEKLAFPVYYSFPEQELVIECKRLIKETDCKKVVLLADSLGDYGCDTNSDLPTLINKLRKIDPNVGFALNNLNIAHFIQFFEPLAKLIEQKTIIHLNLPIQSASDRILTLMNRKYYKQDIEYVFGYLNKIKFKEFDTHLIIGFPSETKKDFQETVNLVLKFKPKYVLANSYMETPSIPSSNISDKINEDVIKNRLLHLKNIFEENNIICNTDQSELSQERCRRLNII